MQMFEKVRDSEEERARARLLAHFEDNPKSVFYSRQLEVIFEREYFHWVTNRALRRLVDEGRIHTEWRQLSTGSAIKLLWHRNYRFYKRSADEVFKLVDGYTTAATDGALGLQGEHLVLAAFARQKFLLVAEEAKSYNGRTWDMTGHDLDLIFERDGVGYGVEVKNTLGYLDVKEFLAKLRLCLHIGVRPVFAVRALPKTWASALIRAGGYAMIMRYQFYPWNHKDLADRLRSMLGLPVDTPRRIEQGTMQRFENWIAEPPSIVEADEGKVRALLDKMEKRYVLPAAEEEPSEGPEGPSV
jgi:hypothetical protein